MSEMIDVKCGQIYWSIINHIDDEGSRYFLPDLHARLCRLPKDVSCTDRIRWRKARDVPKDGRGIPVCVCVCVCACACACVCVCVCV